MIITNDIIDGINRKDEKYNYYRDLICETLFANILKDTDLYFIVKIEFEQLYHIKKEMSGLLGGMFKRYHVVKNHDNADYIEISTYYLTLESIEKMNLQKRREKIEKLKTIISGKQ
jgi:hypothetical protein